MLGYLVLLEKCRKGRSQLESSLALSAGDGAALLLVADQISGCRNALNFFPSDEKLFFLNTPCVYILCLNSELKTQTEIVMYWPLLERKEFDGEQSIHASKNQSQAGSWSPPDS